MLPRQSASSTVRFSLSLPHIPILLNDRNHIAVLVVGHTNCGGAVACHNAANTPPSKPTTPLGRWLAPLTEHVRTLKLEGLSKSEALTKVVEESVRVQVANVVNTAPVQAVWATGQKNLWVHGLVYELETGRLRDLGITQGGAPKTQTK